MRFFGGGNATADSKDLDLPFSEKDQFDVAISTDELTWDLAIPGLTTQYKSFYFDFADGSAGYIQYAYGNLGVLVKVAPLGYSYYTPGKEPIVASHTLRASQMKVSKDRTGVNVAQHSLLMDADHLGWKATIDDQTLKYNLRFRVDSEALVINEFGRQPAQSYLRQKFIPRLTVTGTVVAHGRETSVTGYGTYSEAYYTNIKFTDFCNEFTNFRLANADSSQVLQLMQYIPRGGTSEGPLIANGSYTKDGKVVAICFNNKSLATGRARHIESGYDLPTDLKIEWAGQTLDGKSFSASCAIKANEPSSTTDVLNMFPKFFKDIVAIFAGLPYVFCWKVPETVAIIEVDGVKHELRGISTTELTRVHKPAQ